MLQDILNLVIQFLLLEDTDKYNVLHINDTGSGIAPEHLNLVLIAFTRLKHPEHVANKEPA